LIKYPSAAAKVPGLGRIEICAGQNVQFNESGTGSGAGDQRRKQIRFEVGNLALQHRRYALQAHAGVDARLGQRSQR
jgi:hypothetical protein